MIGNPYYLRGLQDGTLKGLQIASIRTARGFKASYDIAEMTEHYRKFWEAFKRNLSINEYSTIAPNNFAGHHNITEVKIPTGRGVLKTEGSDPLYVYFTLWARENFNPNPKKVNIGYEWFFPYINAPQLSDEQGEQYLVPILKEWADRYASDYVIYWDERNPRGITGSAKGWYENIPYRDPQTAAATVARKYSTAARALQATFNKIYKVAATLSKA